MFLSCQRCVFAALQRKPELLERDLVVPILVHLPHQLRGIAIAEHPGNGRPFQKLRDILLVQKSFSLRVELGEHFCKDLVFVGLLCGHDLPHELLVGHLAIGGDRSDEVLDVLGSPLPAQARADLLRRERPVVVLIEHHEEVVQFPQLRKVLTGGEVGQQRPLKIVRLGTLQDVLQDLLVHLLVRDGRIREPRVCHDRGDG
mmetsp:Transcript_65773/g.183210  ORF Transcript_65773/g.183210 Transcript_65773/m.183210 type:complete len:201 (-) Transcript_65773:1536-2138(-)